MHDTKERLSPFWIFMTLTDAFLNFVLPLTNGDFRDPIFRDDRDVCTSVIIWQAWTWSSGLRPEILRAMQDQGAPI